MSLKFSLTHNTPSDWAKAATTAFGAAVAGFTAATADGSGVTSTEWFGILLAVGVAFATALGFYSASDTPTAPDDLEPVNNSAEAEGETS